MPRPAVLRLYRGGRAHEIQGYQRNYQKLVSPMGLHSKSLKGPAQATLQLSVSKDMGLGLCWNFSFVGPIADLSQNLARDVLNMEAESTSAELRTVWVKIYDNQSSVQSSRPSVQNN